MPSLRHSQAGRRRDLPAALTASQRRRQRDRRESSVDFLATTPLPQLQENELDVSDEYFGGGKADTDPAARPALSPSVNNR